MSTATTREADRERGTVGDSSFPDRPVIDRRAELLRQIAGPTAEPSAMPARETLTLVGTLTIVGCRRDPTNLRIAEVPSNGSSERATRRPSAFGGYRQIRETVFAAGSSPRHQHARPLVTLEDERRLAASFCLMCRAIAPSDTVEGLLMIAQ